MCRGCRCTDSEACFDAVPGPLPLNWTTMGEHR